MPRTASSRAPMHDVALPLPLHAVLTLQDRASSWEARVSALHELEASARAAASSPPDRAAIVQQIHSLAPALALCVADLRSTLVKEVCRCIEALAGLLGAEFVLAAGDELVPALLRRSGTTKAVIRESAVDAANAMFEFGVSGVSFHTARLVSRTVLDRKLPNAIRASAAQFIGMILVEDCLPGLHVIGEAVDDAIVGGCKDPDESVRAISRENWRKLEGLDHAAARELITRLSPQISALIVKEKRASPTSGSPRSPQSNGSGSLSSRPHGAWRKTAQRALPGAVRVEATSTSPRSPGRPQPVGPAQRGPQRAARVKPPVMTAGSTLPPTATMRGGEGEATGARTLRKGRPMMHRPARRSVMPNMQINLQKPWQPPAADVARKNLRRSVPVMDMPIFDSGNASKKQVPESADVAPALPETVPSVRDETPTVKEVSVDDASNSVTKPSLPAQEDSVTTIDTSHNSPDPAKLKSGSYTYQSSPVTSETSQSGDRPKALIPIAEPKLVEDLLATSSVASEVTEATQKQPQPACVAQEGNGANESVSRSPNSKNSNGDYGHDRVTDEPQGPVTAAEQTEAAPVPKEEPSARSESNSRKARISYLLAGNYSPRQDSPVPAGPGTSTIGEDQGQKGDDAGKCVAEATHGMAGAAKEPEGMSLADNLEDWTVPEPSSADIDLLLSIGSERSEKSDAVESSEKGGSATAKESRSWDALVQDLERRIALDAEDGRKASPISETKQVSSDGVGVTARIEERDKENQHPAVVESSAGGPTEASGGTKKRSPEIDVKPTAVPARPNHALVSRPGESEKPAVPLLPKPPALRPPIGASVQNAALPPSRPNVTTASGRSARPWMGGARRSVMPGTKIDLNLGPTATTRNGVSKPAPKAAGARSGVVRKSEFRPRKSEFRPRKSEFRPRKSEFRPRTNVPAVAERRRVAVDRPRAPAAPAAVNTATAAPTEASTAPAAPAAAKTARQAKVKRPAPEKKVLPKEIQVLIEWMRRCNQAKKQGWKERCAALEAFGEACKKVQSTPVSVRLAEDCVGMLGDYIQDTHHRVATGGLDGLFFLLLCAEGSSSSLQRALERRDDVLHRILGLLGSSRENLRLAAGRVMQSFDVQFRPEVAVSLVMRAMSTGGGEVRRGGAARDGRVAEMGCEQVAKAFERAAASGEGFLWKTGLLEAVLRGVAGMKQDRHVAVRRGADRVLAAVKLSLPGRALEMACGKYGVSGLLAA